VGRFKKNRKLGVSPGLTERKIRYGHQCLRRSGSLGNVRIIDKEHREGRWEMFRNHLLGRDRRGGRIGDAVRIEKRVNGNKTCT